MLVSSSEGVVRDGLVGAILFKADMVVGVSLGMLAVVEEVQEVAHNFEI
jgi:Ca2+/H+ antiporter